MAGKKHKISSRFKSHIERARISILARLAVATGWRKEPGHPVLLEDMVRSGLVCRCCWGYAITQRGYWYVA